MHGNGDQVAITIAVGRRDGNQLGVGLDVEITDLPGRIGQQPLGSIHRARLRIVQAEQQLVIATVVADAHLHAFSGIAGRSGGFVGALFEGG